jgi:FMN phosphatase YigB (HAD superfamily)
MIEARQNRAVVFDLFHTLIDTEHLRPDGFDAITTVAEICGVERQPLRTFWDDTYLERETNIIDLTDLTQRYVDRFDRRLSAQDRAAIDAAFGVCKDDALRHPDPGMVALVAGLATTTRIGVLSNCHEREVRCWPASPFDDHVTSFGRSTRIGTMKPEAEPYEWVLADLDADATTSVYVGNGSSDELLGARRAGFGTVVHCNIYDRSNGLVAPAEQRRRATQADASVETVADLDGVLKDAVGRDNIAR